MLSDHGEALAFTAQLLSGLPHVVIHCSCWLLQDQIIARV